VLAPSREVVVEASGTTKANYLRVDQKRAHAWDDHGCSRRQGNVENDVSGWMVEEGELVDSSHDVEADWQLAQRGVRTVGSDPKGKPPDRVVIAVGGHRKSSNPL
jgi:hypothetical protein